MLHSPEEVLCFYVQDIVYACRDVKEKILNTYTNQCLRKIDTEKLEDINFEIAAVIEFVKSLPKIYNTRSFIVTGATNDQVFIADWQYLKETFVGYMNKIAKHLKFYYKNISKFYDDSGVLNTSLVLKIREKYYKHNDVDNMFNLAINYLFDVSPLVHYDKFRDPLPKKQ
jgi:hypothetical protein